MYINSATIAAKTERSAKFAAKRSPWYINYKQIIEPGAIADDGHGGWWIYTLDNVRGGAWDDGWHKLEPTGRVDTLTGADEPVYVDLHT